MADEPERKVDVDKLLHEGRKQRYSDRMRISPFKQDYYQRKGYLPGRARRSRRLSTRT